MEKQPSGLQLWILGARPRTLPAAFVPVFVAFGIAIAQDVEQPKLWWCGVFALIVSVALQVGVNYANDYSDGIKGTDNKRVGPLRLVGSGLVPEKTVKIAAFIAFGIAAVFGLFIAMATTLLLIPLGALCIAAGWLYTGGPKPYGYLGFGELFVFVFFGLVATCGSVYAITQTIDAETVFASCIVGLLACALLVVNNLRDIPGDTTSNKLTLAVRMGDAMTRKLYYAMFLYVVLLIVLIGTRDRSVLIALVGLVAAYPALKAVKSGALGRDLIPVLGATGKAQLAIGLLLAASLASSLRMCGTGQQDPLWSQLHKIEIPVLLIAGSRDTKFTAIATRMHELIPQSTLSILGHAGHNAHLDQPIAFGETVNAWLQGQTHSKQ